MPSITRAGTVEGHEKSTPSAKPEIRPVAFLETCVLLYKWQHTQEGVWCMFVCVLSVMVLLDHHGEKPHVSSRDRERW